MAAFVPTYTRSSDFEKDGSRNLGDEQLYCTGNYQNQSRRGVDDTCNGTVESGKLVPTSSPKVSQSRAGQIVSILELSPSFQ